MHLTLLIGIQASGKSTFYFQHFGNSHIRINLDMLKTRPREKVIFDACLTAKQPIVVDNTNVTRDDRARYIAPAKSTGFEIVGYFFRSDLNGAYQRNRARAVQQVVPDMAILATLRRLEIPAMEEGFDRLYEVTLGENLSFEITPMASPSNLSALSGISDKQEETNKARQHP